MSPTAPVLLGGTWRQSTPTVTRASLDPTSGASIAEFPQSTWDEVDHALEQGAVAYEEMKDVEPGRVAAMLENLADRMTAASGELAMMANQETALPVEPRLVSVELPRTTDQLRQAAATARTRSWKSPTLSPRSRIASIYSAVPGVVSVFGPNNFPFAFNSVGGGDFAAAIATGHPVLAKANPGHMETTRLLAHEALLSALEAGLPAATVQLLYDMPVEAGLRWVADPRIAATAFTGSRKSGLALKSAADAAGRLIYLEMSSVNPVVVLPGAIAERAGNIAHQIADSLLLGSGQFCTSPGLIFVGDDPAGDDFVDALVSAAVSQRPSTLVGEGVWRQLGRSVAAWREAGAEVMGTSETPEGERCVFPTTILSVSGIRFSSKPYVFQEEAFGNASLVVRFQGLAELQECLHHLDGNLTGTVFHSADDDELYSQVAPLLRQRVGRLISNKPPTGVAVVPAMSHGGPYPATGHPGFTAVGIPASMLRFAMLQCYDNIDDRHLPPELQADNPLGIQRLVGDEWTRDAIAWG